MTDDDTNLVLAAGAAAGLDVGVIHQRPHRRCPEGWTPWNPLESDADAFRLAVALRLNVLHFANNVAATQAGRQLMFDDRVPCSSDGEDRRQATRRAIVRAAAALKDTA